MALSLNYIFDKFNSICPVPDKLQLQMRQCIIRIEVPKNHILLQPGQICDHYYYIEKGILSCHPLIDGKEYTGWLMFEGDIATSVPSFNNRVPSEETIRAATDCTLHLLSWQHANDFAIEYEAFRVIRYCLTFYYYQLNTQIIVQKNRPPEKFYEYLKEAYVNNFDSISRKLLAAHMGISEALLYEIIKKSK
jgi:CRP-like cAMP-binding protein